MSLCSCGSLQDGYTCLLPFVSTVAPEGLTSPVRSPAIRSVPLSYVCYALKQLTCCRPLKLSVAAGLIPVLYVSVHV